MAPGLGVLDPQDLDIVPPEEDPPVASALPTVTYPRVEDETGE
jgi:hypothetical protein